MTFSSFIRRAYSSSMSGVLGKSFRPKFMEPALREAESGLSSSTGFKRSSGERPRVVAPPPVVIWVMMGQATRMRRDRPAKTGEVRGGFPGIRVPGMEVNHGSPCFVSPPGLLSHLIGGDGEMGVILTGRDTPGRRHRDDDFAHHDPPFGFTAKTPRTPRRMFFCPHGGTNEILLLAISAP